MSCHTLLHCLMLLGIICLVQAAPARSACTQLQQKYPQVVFARSTANYTAEVRDVWSETCITAPACSFEPTSAKQLADGLAIVVAAKSKFSVRSRGHMPVPGANGVDNGVFISLSGLNQRQFLPGNEIVQIGPGQTWGDVYRYVSPFGRGVAGGRFSPVGVGGLLLGGGINYFGSQVGFSCDTVKNFEVVLANSSIVNANASSNSELFWALKGGNNNFGIVTRFDVQTVPATKIYGGFSVFSPTQGKQFLSAVTNYTLRGGGSYDAKSAILPNVIIDAASGNTSYSLVSFYEGGDASSAALAQFKALRPAVDLNAVFNSFSDYTAITDIAAFSDQSSRWLFGSTTVKVSDRSAGLLNKTFVETVRSQLSSLADRNGSTFTLSIQPITTAWLRASKKAGGNAIDLDPSEPLLSVLINIQWQDPRDDSLINDLVRNFISRVDSASRNAGLSYNFRYLNDAQAGQEIYSSYGNGRSLPRMKRIQQAYDPKGILKEFFNTGFPLK